MKNESIYRKDNCPRVFYANADEGVSYFANDISKYEIDGRNSPDDWHLFKSENSCAKTATELTKSANLVREKMTSENHSASCIFSPYVQESEEARFKNTDKHISHKRLKSSFSCDSVDSAITGASKDSHLKALLASPSPTFMPPRNQSMIATAENRYSPDRINSLSPDSGVQNPPNDYRSINGHNRDFSNSSDMESLDTYQQTQNAINCNQTILSDGSTSDCDNNPEQFYDEIENGGSASKRKSSSCDTIYPWMKESRQNQKKTSKSSVSSSG